MTNRGSAAVPPRPGLALLEAHREALVAQRLRDALAGDRRSLDWCLAQLYPANRATGSPGPLDLPPLTGAADAPAFLMALLELVRQGRLAPQVATRVALLVQPVLQALALADIDGWLAALEEGRT